jgi:phosphopantothenate synthetase
MKNDNLSTWLETPAYQKQKAIIAIEINSLRRADRIAPITIPYPGRVTHTDFSVFKQTKEMKGKIKAAKLNHKEGLKRAYGQQANKFLNIPGKGIESPIILQF